MIIYTYETYHIMNDVSWASEIYLHNFSSLSLFAHVQWMGGVLGRVMNSWPIIKPYYIWGS